MKKQRKQKLTRKNKGNPMIQLTLTQKKNNVADDDKPSGVEIVQEDVRNFMESFLQTECSDSMQTLMPNDFIQGGT